MNKNTLIVLITLTGVLVLSFNFYSGWPVSVPHHLDIKIENTQEEKISPSDTLDFNGEYILFIRPSNKKFKALVEEEPGTYEIDSDFGFGISATIDSLKNNPKYYSVKNKIVTERFVKIEGCKNCPKIIDTDSTIVYGLILTKPDKEMQILRNVHSMHYLTEIDEYFGFKN